MNEIDLSPRTDPPEDDREATPMLILLGILFVASALTVMISYVKGHDALFVLSGIFAPVFMGCFVLEYFGDVHFVLGNDSDDNPSVKESEWMDRMPPMDEWAEPTAEEPKVPKTLGWTCSYCDTINIWNPGREAVRCVHCGARYDGEELRELE